MFGWVEGIPALFWEGEIYPEGLAPSLLTFDTEIFIIIIFSKKSAAFQGKRQSGVSVLPRSLDVLDRRDDGA